NLPLQQFSTRGQELAVHRERPIVIYCRTGRRSAIVAKYLHLSGFLHVRSMAGGMEAWTEDSRSSSST
ncbi:MAG: rhodanese-like domain-containing protein, partial [Planctomycetota bacterium]|nr:rhodanese-like domain-containing protein [Planctomycetota bacterium]